MPSAAAISFVHSPCSVSCSTRRSAGVSPNAQTCSSASSSGAAGSITAARAAAPPG
jgi:hypothetical protein